MGHSDALNSHEKRSLAFQRASAVREALVTQGAAPNRLQLETALSDNETPNQPAWQRRYVAFAPIAPTANH